MSLVFDLCLALLGSWAGQVGGREGVVVPGFPWVLVPGPPGRVEGVRTQQAAHLLLDPS